MQLHSVFSCTSEMCYTELMDDWDDDRYYDGEDDLGDDFEDTEDEDKMDGSSLSDDELELLGGMDGESDGNLGMARYSSHGSSVDLSELTPEQWESYDRGYSSGYSLTDNFDDEDDDDF